MKTRNNFLHLSLGIVLFYAAAYYVCLFSMKTVYGYSSAWIEIAYHANIIFSSFTAALFLLLIIFLSRNFFIILFLYITALSWMLICHIYYNYFYSIPHIYMIRQIYLLPKVTRQFLFHGLNAATLAVLISGLLSICFSIFLGKTVRKRRLRAATRRKMFFVILAIVAMCLCKEVLLNFRCPVNHQYLVDGVRALKLHGFFPVYSGQLLKHLFRKKQTIPYPGKINLEPLEEISKIPQKKNIIILQIESLDSRMIDLCLGQKYVMPYLNSLKRDSIFFEHFFAQHRGGASSDAELSSLTSLLPLNSHSGFRTADYSKITPLSRVLVQEGYHCVGMHANAGDYFNRTHSYALLGFNDFFDKKAFTGEAKGWHSKDKIFFKQAVSIIRKLPQPFFAYIITMQSHGPFMNYYLAQDTFDFNGIGKELRNYILTMHEVDQAISFLIRQLASRGLLQDAVILIYGDSSSSPKELSKQINMPNIYPGDSYVPLFIVSSKPSMTKRISYKVGSHLDIAPTLLDILGIKEPDGWLGSSLLRGIAGKAVLNYGRPYVLMNKANEVVRDYDEEGYLKFIEYSVSLLDQR